MSVRALLLWALVMAAGTGPLAAAPPVVAMAEPSPESASPATDDEPSRQILVMLRATPPHYRPDSGYSGSYVAAPDRQARRRLARALAREHGLRLVDDWPMPTLGLDCFVLEAQTRENSERVVRELSRDPRVESVQSMNLFHLLSLGDPLAAAQPATARWHLRELHAVATGKRVTVAELDTGVDVDHPDLRGQVSVARDFVDSAMPPAETHGTQIAGIIVARADDGIGIAGIAPDARLMALRACWQQPGNSGTATCSSFTLAKALQFALQNKAQVINLSLSGPSDRLLGRLLDVAIGDGVIVVGAVDARARDGGFPAGHAGVLAVAGAPVPGGARQVLLAPAKGIPAPTPGGGWSLVSGPSFAAAQVTGLVALLRELSPGLQAAQARAALDPVTELGLPPRRPVLIDACAAVVRVAGRCACDCTAAPTVGWMPRR